MTEPLGERWKRVEDLFHRAFDLDSEEIERFLQAECAGDEPLKAEVSGLLKGVGPAEDFFGSLGAQLFAGGDDDGGRASNALHETFDPVVGTKIKHYEISRLLGEGGMGQVYQGLDTILQRGVALKFLPDFAPDSEPYKRFMLEARATAALDHENVCIIHEVSETDDGRPFLVMALYEGETLRSKLRDGALSIEKALSYAIQSCSGLAAAHGAGIIHRDVKPGNLFITRDDTVKVLDFGLAKLPDITLTGTRRAMGTLTYISPEQMSGERVDPRTDVWSIGVVLYEMLTGEKPFGANKIAGVINAIMRADPLPPRMLSDSIPAELDAVVMSTLEKDRERRPESILALKAQLLQCK